MWWLNVCLKFHCLHWFARYTTVFSSELYSSRDRQTSTGTSWSPGPRLGSWPWTWNKIHHAILSNLEMSAHPGSPWPMCPMCLGPFFWICINLFQSVKTPDPVASQEIQRIEKKRIEFPAPAPPELQQTRVLLRPCRPSWVNQTEIPFTWRIP